MFHLFTTLTGHRAGRRLAWLGLTALAAGGFGCTAGGGSTPGADAASAASPGVSTTGATTAAAQQLAGTFVGADGSVLTFDDSGLVSVDLGTSAEKSAAKQAGRPPRPTGTPKPPPASQPAPPPEGTPGPGTEPPRPPRGDLPPPPRNEDGQVRGDGRPLLAEPFLEPSLRDILRFNRNEVQRTVTSSWSNGKLSVDSTLEYTRATSEATEAGWSSSVSGTLRRTVTLGDSYGDLAGTYEIVRDIAGSVDVAVSADGQTATATISASITTSTNTVPAEAGLPIPGPDRSFSDTITLTRQ